LQQAVVLLQFVEFLSGIASSTSGCMCCPSNVRGHLPASDQASRASWYSESAALQQKGNGADSQITKTRRNTTWRWCELAGNKDAHLMLLKWQLAVRCGLLSLCAEGVCCLYWGGACAPSWNVCAFVRVCPCCCASVPHSRTQTRTPCCNGLSLGAQHLQLLHAGQHYWYL